MAYEIFQRTTTRVADPAVSVLPDGRITFNAAGSRLFQAQGIKAVKILWDREKCGIALQGVPKGDRNAYSIAFSRGRSSSISPKAFLSYIGWSAKKRETVSATWDPNQKMMEAQLPSKFVTNRGATGTG